MLDARHEARIEGDRCTIHGLGRRYIMKNATWERVS